ncbi:hypothetical protein GT755_34890 [Herbidospora sp. NEAU-GS84]|uniref:Uncharacterized protein n=1 Tax=Herbidospora solisilvae TaxID=2696284 RepID=A0A7C9J7L9_9ACTN|nr:hypothetical protein [Herbidospora solisilvae]NAS26842.1 hypothetical protein [Herbidospora solisilvae]
MPLLDSGEDLIGLDEGMFYVQDVDGFDGQEYPADDSWPGVIDNCIQVPASSRAVTASVRLECWDEVPEWPDDWWEAGAGVVYFESAEICVSSVYGLECVAYLYLGRTESRWSFRILRPDAPDEAYLVQFWPG